ncbi:hypothetical protein AXW84_08305 [Hymenobacter sp. PAMC 26628]|nr:hypothetical protein AXW84_08305 [Hymenobacter sp. PAMC 26628]
MEYVRPTGGGWRPVWPSLVAQARYLPGLVARPSGPGAELLGWSYGPEARGQLAAPAWGSGLALQQAVYEELLATHELPAPGPTHRPPSARKIARDLPGWAPPRPGAPASAQP